MKKAKYALNGKIKKQLVDLALKYRKNAYSPYCKYKVGAAVLGGSGKIYSGCNIENVSFGLTICAERTAIFSAVSCGEKIIKAIALAAKNPKSCGACRQVMAEFAGKNTSVLLIDASKKGKIKVSEYKLSQLLPLAFGSRDLK